MTERKVIAQGKTKIIYAGDNPKEVVIFSKDDITAGDGAKKDLIIDKGILATTTTVNCFRLLESHGVPTHFLQHTGEREFAARKVTMIPVEIVARRIATGSSLKRNPGIEEGTIFPNLKIEFFLKDDSRHDPLMIPNFTSMTMLLYDPKKPLKDGFLEETRPRELYRKQWMDQCRQMCDLAERTFMWLESAWKRQEVTLVDLKIECGITPEGAIVVSDVIDNDSWRVWPKGDKEQMKDKQVYRNLTHTTPEALGAIKKNYAWVAEQTTRFCA